MTGRDRDKAQQGARAQQFWRGRMDEVMRAGVGNWFLKEGPVSKPEATLTLAPVESFPLRHALPRY